jgi:uncharacterized protein
MFIETKEIGPEGLIVDRRIECAPLPLEGGESAQIATVHLTGELYREEEGISFTGEIATVATLPCSRCLDPYALPLDLDFELLYTTTPEAASKGESRVDEERITLAQFDGKKIDLTALLAEQIYLGLPLKPLCRADCRGLCPKCGTNLNLGACGCQEERVEDPRLLILKKLL